MKVDTAGLFQAARDGVITVEFMKIGTDEKRIMPCTLNTELSQGNVPAILEQREESENYVVWAMDKEAWRSFRVSTLVKWYEGYPHEDVTTDS